VDQRGKKGANSGEMELERNVRPKMKDEGTLGSINSNGKAARSHIFSFSFSPNLTPLSRAPPNLFSQNKKR
jgi:hypothetical protein